MKSKILVLSTFFLALPAALFAWGNGCGFGGAGPYGHMGYRFFGGYHGGGMIMGIVLLILVGILIFFAVRYFRNGGQFSGNAETPLSILKTRYAKGEITKEEFDAMKKDL